MSCRCGSEVCPWGGLVEGETQGGVMLRNSRLVPYVEVNFVVGDLKTLMDAGDLRREYLEYLEYRERVSV